MMNIIGPPSDADIQQMKCSDVMAPVLLNYVCKIRKAKATQQQALAAAAPQEQQQQQQQQQLGISLTLASKFTGASPVLLLLLQRLLSFDPEFRISAGDAFVELSLSSAAASLSSPSSPSSSSSSSSAAAAASCSLSGSSVSPTPAHARRHPIDATLEGGHTGEFLSELRVFFNLFLGVRRKCLSV